MRNKSETKIDLYAQQGKELGKDWLWLRPPAPDDLAAYAKEQADFYEVWVKTYRQIAKELTK